MNGPVRAIQDYKAIKTTGIVLGVFYCLMDAFFSSFSRGLCYSK